MPEIAQNCFSHQFSHSLYARTNVECRIVRGGEEGGVKKDLLCDDGLCGGTGQEGVEAAVPGGEDGRGQHGTKHDVTADCGEVKGFSILKKEIN
jgi:hypothetical protein